MENTIKALNELKSINGAYGLSVEQIDGILTEIPDAKVCIPIIGKFSSGKSALVNTLLGYSKKLLKEDITPETAVPTEIVYCGEGDFVRLYGNGGEYKDIEVCEYRETELDAMQITRVKMFLRNNFLGEIPDVMIVDMPGFESGFEIHNKAIDNYLPQSLAYIVTFPADDLIVRASVGDILKELVLNDMPVCIAITKYDKCNDEFNVSFEKLMESLRKFIGSREVTVCLTSSFDRNADEIREFLVQIQEQSQKILSGKFRGNVLSVLEHAQSYLNATLKNSEMGESELDEEEVRLEQQIAGLDSRFTEEKESFRCQISEAIEEIKADVEAALTAEEAAFVVIALNGQDVSSHIKTVVRGAVTASVNKRFVPRVEKYLKRVEKCINSEGIGDVHVSFSFNAKEVSNGLTTSVVAVVAGLVLGLPVIGAIAAGIAYFINKSAAEKKREEQKSEIRSKLRNELYPQILREVENGVETAIGRQMEQIHTSIADEIANQKDILEKAMADLRTRMADEKDTKDRLVTAVEDDLEKLEKIRQMVER